MLLVDNETGKPLPFGTLGIHKVRRSLVPRPQGLYVLHRHIRYLRFYKVRMNPNLSKNVVVQYFKCGDVIDRLISDIKICVFVHCFDMTCMK